MYQIGEKIWKAGDEVTITSKPFELYGAMWQNAINEFGKTIVVATPEQKASDVKVIQEAWVREQEGFRRLNGKSI